MAAPASTSATTFLDLRASIQTEKERRVHEHQARVSGTSRMAFAMVAGQSSPLNLIAQGDSWFDYPLPLFDPSDVLAHLRRIPSMAPEILSMAVHGETAEDMLGVQKIHDLFDRFGDPANGTFDAILFSGGGNDIAGNQFRLWLEEAASVGGDPAKGLNQVRVAAILGVVKAGYEDLIAMRDRVAPNVPIFAHSYDFPIPNGVKVACAGPWLRPGLLDRGWSDVAQGRSIVQRMLAQFDQMLDAFAANPANQFVHVKTQGSLADGQWANELHPTPSGFAVIASKFVDALRSRFPGRI